MTYNFWWTCMFDARSFLAKEVGTPQNVHDLFLSYGIDGPDRAAIDKWFHRSSMPGRWLARLLCILELERGSAVSLATYISARGRA